METHRLASSQAILADLVAFPSLAGSSNLEIARFVEDSLHRRGFRTEVFRTGAKAGVLATLGPPSAVGLVLSGHMDVVPVAGQSWSSDPFRLTARDGRLHGRGTADMKGFLACMLSLAGRVQATRMTAPLHLCFSYDEEIGCVGVRPMLDALAARGFQARFCVVGEPTELRVVTGHKGKLAARATCHGTAAHSALAPQALNAIHLATDLVGVLRAEQDRLQDQGARDEAYEVPFSTIHAGVIAGGTALNIVPERCTVDFEIRTVGGDDAGVILRRIEAGSDAVAQSARARFGTGGIEIATVNAYPGLDTAAEAEAVALVQDAAGTMGTGKVVFGTEGGLFAERLGLPTVICGPGSMAQGHKADEFITPDQLDRCDAMLDRLVARCCLSPG